MDTIATIIFCLVPPIILVVAAIISGTYLKNWYFRRLAKLDTRTQSKIIHRQITVSLIPLTMVIVFAVGVMWPSLHIAEWSFPFLCSIVVLTVLLTLFDYYDMYRRSKSLSDIVSK